MRLRHRRQHEHGDEEAIDLAPMLDFVLNLLIFFIITAVFVKEVGLNLNRAPPSPPSSNQKEDENSVLIISVHKNGDVSIDKRYVDPAAVRANVERFRGEKPQGPVIVAVDSKAPTGAVVKVLDQAKLGGAPDVLLQPAVSRN